MSIKTITRPLFLLVALASLAACTTIEGPVAPADTPSTPASDTVDTTASDPVTPLDTPVEPVEPSPPSANPAVIALLDNADNDVGAGRLPSAIAAVERALRIEPRNPALWQKLAMLKLEKGDYAQAENFAARSNSWAGSNRALMARNWRIISEARSLRGDNSGARAATERARLLEQ